MSSSSKRDFFRLLKKSGLLTTAQRVEGKEHCKEDADAEAAAKTLVSRGMLTGWQAAQLLRGRSRFFLGKYKLLKFRGRGAMGIVFKAEHPAMQRPVAIKVLSKALLDRPRSVARFLREIRSAAVLNHPNLVVAYDADQFDGTYCLVMEYVSGRSLKSLLEEHKRLPVFWSCECIRQAALALAHVHEKGIVHRDVKPSNLIVTHTRESGLPQVKLLDVGLARFVSEREEEGALTRDGQIVGTGDYMAPEQVAKARQADIRADIYGLGVTLYELLSGTPPLLGGTLLQTYVNRLQSEPPPISTNRHDAPAPLDAILSKMLKPKVEDRYQSPGEVAADLAALLAGSAPQWSLNTTGDAESPSAASSSMQDLPPDERELALHFQTGERAAVSGSLAGLELGEGPGKLGSSDASVDGSIHEFLEQVGSGSSEGSSYSQLLRGEASTPFPSTIGQASQMIRGFFQRMSNLRAGEEPPKSKESSAVRKPRRNQATGNRQKKHSSRTGQPSSRR